MDKSFNDIKDKRNKYDTYKWNDKKFISLYIIFIITIIFLIFYRNSRFLWNFVIILGIIISIYIYILRMNYYK
jgi:hypothetical protein